jgi:hypothetical protein
MTGTKEEAGRRGLGKWWRDAAIIGAIATVLVPLATGLTAWSASFIHEYFETQRFVRQLRLSEQGQFQEIRQKYLDRAIDPQRNPQYRQSVLSFLVTTLSTDDPMKNWAQDELKELSVTKNGATRVSLTAEDLKLWQEFLAQKSKQEKSRQTQAASTRSKSSKGQRNELSLNPGQAGLERQGQCCVTCQGLTICAKSVNTECGSCSAE